MTQTTTPPTLGDLQKRIGELRQAIDAASFATRPALREELASVEAQMPAAQRRDREQALQQLNAMLGELQTRHANVREQLDKAAVAVNAAQTLAFQTYARTMVRTVVAQQEVAHAHQLFADALLVWEPLRDQVIELERQIEPLELQVSRLTAALQ